MIRYGLFTLSIRAEISDIVLPFKSEARPFLNLTRAKSETNSKHECQKALKQTGFGAFEIRICDLFRVSCFGFRISDLVEIGKLFSRRS